MKKIALILISLLVFNFADAGEVTFIYLNGSNTNDKKMTEWFFKGTRKFHGELTKQIEKDPFVSKNMLRGMKINPEPDQLYWGNLSEEDLRSLKENLDFWKITAPQTAKLVRRFIFECLHDAVWVSKYSNMEPALSLIHTEVLEENEKGNKVVLFGYSAGSFLTYNYLLLKLPSLNIHTLAATNTFKYKPEHAKALADAKIRNTCIDAMFKSDMFLYDMNNYLVANPDINAFKKSLNNIDNFTKDYCAPEDTILGVVNYASPLVLFYSEFYDRHSTVNEANIILYKYLMENNIFGLTVNWSDDPLAFPVVQGTPKKKFKGKIDPSVEVKNGFVYDKSNVSSLRTCAMAHVSYWSAGKRFAKNITNAYKEGVEQIYKARH
jgi:hypothetical protein